MKTINLHYYYCYIITILLLLYHSSLLTTVVTAVETTTTLSKYTKHHSSSANKEKRRSFIPQQQQRRRRTLSTTNNNKQIIWYQPISHTSSPLPNNHNNNNPSLSATTKENEDEITVSDFSDTIQHWNQINNNIINPCSDDENTAVSSRSRSRRVSCYDYDMLIKMLTLLCTWHMYSSFLLMQLCSSLLSLIYSSMHTFKHIQYTTHTIYHNYILTLTI